MLLLPRGYLSYSAMTCFKSSKARFEKEYLEKSKKLDTKYLRFGKGIAELIENGEHKHLLPDLVVYDLNEYLIETTIGDVPILSKIDSCKSDYTSFRDDKTGKKPWTQVQVEKLDQLLFYAVAIRSKHGRMPKDAWIDWIETKDAPKTGLHNDINVTGKVVSFKRTFTKKELDLYEQEIIKTAHEISDFYKEWINNNIC